MRCRDQVEEGVEILPPRYLAVRVDSPFKLSHTMYQYERFDLNNSTDAGMKKLIIFDCDGVLVDSETIGCRIDAMALTKMGYHISTEDFIKKYAGLSDKTMSARVTEETGIQIPDEYLAARLPRILEAFENQLRPLVEPLLSWLDVGQIQRCVASGSSRSRVIRSLEVTNQLNYFTQDSIFTAQQVQKGKPAPDLFEFAAKQLNTQPSECLVIEDSVAGIQAAKAAGMEVIGFLGGEHAQHDWYQAPIKLFDIPLAHTAKELHHKVMNYL